MMHSIKQFAIENYRERANGTRSIPVPARPREGWIRTIRKALGMNMAQLGRRIGVGKGRVSQLELYETQDRITLKQLRRVANAANCELVYMLVPRRPIEDEIADQAHRKAKNLVMRAHEQMALEAQGLAPEDLGREVRSYANELAKNVPRDFWD